jgi:putative ABC transport system substrate-binding protein
MTNMPDHRIPAVYPSRYYAISGGLVSYGVDFQDQYRRAASYIDRVLKGEKPADLPGQAPTNNELAINAKTAKELGITVPPASLARADDVMGIASCCCTCSGPLVLDRRSLSRHALLSRT